jgi:hypothetical protein
MTNKLNLPGTDLKITVTNKGPVEPEATETIPVIEEDFVEVKTEITNKLSNDDRSPSNWTVTSNSRGIVEAYSTSGNKFYGNKSEFSKIFTYELK